MTTGLDPAMTLGCGGYGGNITSDNISPRHLLNIKRLAYEVRPAVGSIARSAEVSQLTTPSGPEPATVADFVAESDVRTAIAAHRKIKIGKKTIVTPSARDLGEEHEVFVE